MPYHLRTITAVLLLILAASAFAASDAINLNNQGFEHFNAGRYAEAIENFRAARNLEPDNEILTQNLAMALNAWAVTLGEQSEFARAAHLAEEALIIQPDDPTLRRNLTALRVNWAVHHMQAGNYDLAERELNKAYRTAPHAQVEQIDQQRAENFVLLSRQLNGRNQHEEAANQLQQALNLDADHLVALLDLAQIRYDQGRDLEALDLMVKAFEVDPSVPGLGERIEKIGREAYTEAGFDKRTSRQFTIAYEGDVTESAAKEAEEIMEQAVRDVGTALRYHQDQPLRIVLYTRNQFDEVALVPAWSGAVFDGRIRVPVPGGELDEKSLEILHSTLYHEYTHAVVAALSKANVDAWFNEGLATYFEVEREEREKRYLQDRRTIRRLLDDGQLPSIRSLPPTFVMLDDAEAARNAYLTSRTFTMWLAERFHPVKFRQVLNEVSRGATLEQAIEDTYRRSLPQLESMWRESLQ